MKLVIGITGGTGSGKSTVCSVMKQRGAKIIDADIVAREITEKGKPALSEIERAFGKDVLFPDGSLDRKKLGAVVFSDNEKLNILNGITHKYIIDEIEKTVRSSTCGILVIDAALLFQTGLDRLCDKTVAVTAKEDVRQRRIARRDGLSAKTAKDRIASQDDDAYYRQRADYAIVNDKGLIELKSEAERILKELM